MAKTTISASDVRDTSLTDADIAAANKDGAKATPSLRTLSAAAPTTIAYGDTADAGVGQVASSSDHRHGMPSIVGLSSAGASNVVFSGRVSGDAGYRVWIEAGGVIRFGDGTGVPEVQLYRFEPYGLGTTATFRASLGSEHLWMGQVVGGKAGLVFGASFDTNLYRASANELKTDDFFTTTQGLSVYAGNHTLRRYAISTDVNPTFAIENASGEIKWGVGGATAPDTNLYRNSADALKTDDQFFAVSGLSGMTAHAPVASGAATTNLSTTSGTFVDVGTPFNQSVTAPPSGRVFLLATLDLTDPNTGAAADVQIGYQVDSGSDVVIGGHAFDANNPGRMSVTSFTVITGLTPGTSYAISLRWKVTSGTAQITGGSRGGAQVGSQMLLLPLP